ncbi:MAG: hypothetical protein K2L54_03905, partial [Clostridiales bacterium]|nr:hypothetical protein [Clostridiales bacterium]
SIDQREINQVAFENSSTRIFLSDSSKVNGRNGIYIYSHLSAFDLIVLDKLSPEHAEAFKNLPIITS